MGKKTVKSNGDKKNIINVKNVTFFICFLLIMFCSIFVNLVNLKNKNSFFVDGSSNTISIGDVINLEVYGADKKETVKYSSSKPSVAIVDRNGVVTGVSEGVATIKVENGRSVSFFVVTVTDIETSNAEVSSSIKIDDGKINVIDTGTAYNLKRGINAQYTTSNTTNLNMLIQYAHEKSAVLYFPAGYYMLGNLNLGEKQTITFEGASPVAVGASLLNSGDTTHSIWVFNGSKGKANPMLDQTGGVTILKKLAVLGTIPGNSVNYTINGSYFSIGGKGGGDDDSRDRVFAEDCQFSGWTSALGGAHLDNGTIVYSKVIGVEAYTHIALLTERCSFYSNGIALSQITDSRINGNYFGNNNVDIALGNGVGGVSIFDSNFANTAYNSIYIASSPNVYDIASKKIINGFAASLKYGTGAHDVIVYGNTFTNSKRTSVYISKTIGSGSHNSTGILLLSNTFNGGISYSLPAKTSEINSQSVRVFASYCDDCMIASNRENIATNASIYLKNNSNLILTNNFPSSNSYYLKCAGKNTISGKVINDNSNRYKSWDYSKSC